jgi:hypothetical protein
MIKNQCKGYLEYFEGEDETKEEPELNDDTIESLGNAETEHEAAQSAAEIAKQLKTAAAEQARANAAADAKKRALDEEREKASNELAQEAKKLYGDKLSADDFKKAFNLTADDVERLRNKVTADMKTDNSLVNQYVTAKAGEKAVKINVRFSLEIPAEAGTSTMSDDEANKAWFNYHMSRELLKKTVEKSDNLTDDKKDMKTMAARIIIEDALTKGTLDAFKNADPGDFGSQADIDDYTKNLKSNATNYENAVKEFLENPTEENAQNAEQARKTWIDVAKKLGKAVWSGGKTIGKGALSLLYQLSQLLAKLLVVLGPSLAALVAVELIREAAAGAAEDNSGCYMMITKGFDSTMDTTGLSCEKCLSGEDSWVRGMTQLRSCKYGNSKKTVLLVFSKDQDDADQYIKTSTSDPGDCGNQVSASSDTINAFLNSKVYYLNDPKLTNKKICTNHPDNVVCVSNQETHCQIDGTKINDISKITGRNATVVPLAQTADLSQPGADGQLAVFYQYKKFDTGDALNRFIECLGKCAKKTGTSMLWFIGILIGLFALYKFIEFEFDEHEGAIHARVKKD